MQLNQCKLQVCNYSRCSVNKITPNLVPLVLESSITLSENFVIVCVFVQKMEENEEYKRMGEKGRGKMSRTVWLEKGVVD